MAGVRAWSELRLISHVSAHLAFPTLLSFMNQISITLPCLPFPYDLRLVQFVFTGNLGRKSTGDRLEPGKMTVCSE